MAELTLYGVNLWAGALLFARIGAMVMLLPGFGETAVPARVRLSLALILLVLLAPALGPSMPPTPGDLGEAAGAIAGELIVGILIGSMARLIFAALSTGGEIIGFETGLSFAQAADPTLSQAGQIFAVFLGVMGVALVFATDLHHVFLEGVAQSYVTFQAGRLPPLGDMAEMAVEMTGLSFMLGVQIAAPLILAGLVFRVGLGVLSRLIPTIQVFFVTMPLSLLGGFVLLAIGLSGGMIVWIDALQSHATSFP
jgi:flagellar biosynthetic protein FliR